MITTDHADTKYAPLGDDSDDKNDGKEDDNDEISLNFPNFRRRTQFMRLSRM